MALSIESVRDLYRENRFHDVLTATDDSVPDGTAENRERVWLRVQSLHRLGRPDEAFQLAERAAGDHPGDESIRAFLARPEFDHRRPPQLSDIVPRLGPVRMERAASVGGRPKLWFLIRPTAGERDVVLRWADGLGGRVCFLFNMPAESAAVDLSPHTVRHVVGDLIATNSADEELSFRRSAEHFAAAPAYFEPVGFHGVDLRHCLKRLPNIAADYLLRIARALERLRHDGFDHLVVWFNRYSPFYLAILDEAATMGLCEPRDAVLQIVDGALVPMAEIFEIVSPASCLPTYLRAWTKDADVVGPLLAGLGPLEPGGVHVLVATEVGNYIPYLAEAIRVLQDAGVPYRALAKSGAIREQLLPLLSADGIPADRVALIPGVEESRFSEDPQKIAGAVAALFTQIGPRLAKRPPEAPAELGEHTLHYAWLYYNTRQAIRHAYLFCLQIERLDAFLQHDRPACLYTYPALSPYDPALAHLMRARGGTAASAIFLSVNADYRNLAYPQFDRMAVLGTAQTEALAARGYPSDQIVEVGSPLLDAEFAKWTPADARKYIGSVLGGDLAPGPLILVATSAFRQEDEFVWLEWLADSLPRDGSVSAIVKLHRFTYAPPYERRVAEIGHPRLFVTQEGEIYPYLAASDVVVSDVSHAAKQAVYAGKTLWVANISGAPFPYNRFDQEGVARLAATREDFANIVAEAMGEKAFERGEADIARFIRREFTSNDGKARERMNAFFDACIRGGASPAAGPDSAA
ncbi:MAG: hypothetical protein KIS96_11935 [Bauldia sp.]|nr:hypothetical protein [Bauldia sp.]